VLAAAALVTGLVARLIAGIAADETLAPQSAGLLMAAPADRFANGRRQRPPQVITCTRPNGEVNCELTCRWQLA
jgi:hypothetical protein